MKMSAEALGAYNDGQLPKIIGEIHSSDWNVCINATATGAFYTNRKSVFRAGSSSSGQEAYQLNFDASRSSSAYSRNDNYVIPRHLSINYIVKY